MTCGKLAIDEVNPIVELVVSAFGIVGTVVVAEVLDKSVAAPRRRGAARCAVVHADHHAAVEHQAGHSHPLLLRLASRVAVEHVRPVDDGIARHHASRHRLAHGNPLRILHLIGIRQAGYGGLRQLGILVVVHHLCNGRSHTAGSGPSLRAVLLIVVRACQVIGLALIPPAFNHGRDEMARPDDAARTGLSPHGLAVDLNVIVVEILYLVGIEL